MCKLARLLRYIFKRRTLRKIEEDTTFLEYYLKHSNDFPNVTYDEFLRANKYRRLFSRGRLIAGGYVCIP